MSWLFSQALVEEYSEGISSDGEQSVQSSGSHTQLAYLPLDKMTDFSRLSRFGMTFKPLTVGRGEALLTSYLAGFHVRPIPKLRLDAIQRTTFGRRCGEWWQMSLPGTSLPKTSAELQSTKRQKTLNRWVTKPERLPLARQTWVLTTFDQDIGYLHTPTTKGNYCADSMQKWPGCVVWRQVFGKVTPESHEYLMGWPIGWSDLRPLAMDKFQQWQQQHGIC
jgi:hypothetical protein